MSNKKTLCSFPPGLLEEIDAVAEAEHRTRTDLIREALRRYVDSFKRNRLPQKGGDNGPLQNMQASNRFR